VITPSIPLGDGDGVCEQHIEIDAMMRPTPAATQRVLVIEQFQCARREFNITPNGTA
jgi:hypothetical protein